MSQSQYEELFESIEGLKNSLSIIFEALTKNQNIIHNVLTHMEEMNAFKEAVTLDLLAKNDLFRTFSDKLKNTESEVQHLSSEVKNLKN